MQEKSTPCAGAAAMKTAMKLAPHSETELKTRLNGEKWRRRPSRQEMLN
jgi:hypothetical protein